MTHSNNFDNFKKDFEKITGKSYSNDQLELYIQYFQARMLDIQVQESRISTSILQELFNHTKLKNN